MEERVSAESVTDLRTAKFGIQKTRTSQYVFEYKNIWDPVKKRSKPLYSTVSYTHLTLPTNSLV